MSDLSDAEHGELSTGHYDRFPVLTSGKHIPPIPPLFAPLAGEVRHDLVNEGCYVIVSVLPKPISRDHVAPVESSTHSPGFQMLT